MQNDNEFEDEKINSTQNESPKEEKSRRGFLKSVMFGAVAGSVASSVLGKSNQAYATPDDTTILTEISTWLKTTWITEVLPLIKTIKDWYETVKGWINTWNEFVSTFNRGMGLAQDVRDFLTQKQDNWFYQSFVQLKEYINGMMQVDGDILKYRLHYYEPILITKIDSMIFQFDNLVSRAKSAANAYVRLGAKVDPKSDPIRQTKEGKLAIRSTTDQAKYLEAQSRLTSLKQTIESTKKQFPDLLKMNTSTENSAKIFHDLIAPQMIETSLLQCSILTEIYAKLNDLFLMASKEDPIVSSNEKIVTQEDFKRVLNDLSQGTKKGFII